MRQTTDLPELANWKIVILIGHFGRGGAERQALLLARELRERHHLDVEVWSLLNFGQWTEEFAAADVPIRRLGFGVPRYAWVQRCLPIVRQLRASRVRILLPFTTWPNVVAGLTYRIAGVRLCIWGERHAGGERIPSVERIAATQYRRFVANSTAGVEFLAREMRISRARISWIPNGVEVPGTNQSSGWRMRLELHPNQLLVVKVANLTSFKDHATLLRAWKTIQDGWMGDIRPVLALAGGHADKYDECRRFVTETGLDSTVRFLGAIPDVPALLRASDMGVFSSRAEGMPNGVLECMAAGKAVVASDIPGIRDALGPSADEVLVPPGDSQQFSHKLLSLLLNRETRHALGERNRARIRAEFSVECMAERYLKVIQENLPGSQRGWFSSRAMPAGRSA